MNKLPIPGRLWRRGSAELTEVRRRVNPGRRRRRLRRVNFGLILLLISILSPGWGWTQTIEWTKYDNNVPANSDLSSTNGKIPLAATAGRGDAAGVYTLSVLKDGSTYKMWYAASDGGNYRIYYATSSNGLEWTKYTNTTPANSDSNSTGGRIPLGSNGRGDDSGVLAPSVLKDGSTYKMWYTGSDGTYWRIYYATSSNGLDWTKWDNATPENSDGSSTNGKIPVGTNGKGDDAGVQGTFVLKDGSTYKTWYAGSDGANYRIYYATSSNGLEWTKWDNGTPANSDGSSTNGKIPLGSNGKGDDAYAYLPSGIKDGSTYKMWYTGYDGAIDRVYHATSSNGLEWTKLDNIIPPVSDTTNSNSRLGLGTNTKGDDGRLASPSVVMYETGGNRGRYYQMWYSGFDGANWRIYHATFEIPPPAGTIFTFR